MDSLTSSESVPMKNDEGLIARLRVIVGDDGLLFNPEELLVYECDGYTVEKKVPDVVVFPTSTEQVVAVVRLCNELDIPFIPSERGPALPAGRCQSVAA